MLDLSIDELLTTTRAVRKRLDLTRPVEPEVIRECLSLAEQEAAYLTRIADTPRYLTAHLHEVPVHVIPCVEGRAEKLSATRQAAHWGGIWPATWSFMLAARSRGLGTVLTTLHLDFEQEAAEVLGIPYEQVMQVGLIPVAYTLGTTFKPAARKPLEAVLHWNRW